jgi:hypothetical protein
MRVRTPQGGADWPVLRIDDRHVPLNPFHVLTMGTIQQMAHEVARLTNEEARLVHPKVKSHSRALIVIEHDRAMSSEGQLTISRRALMEGAQWIADHFDEGGEFMLHSENAHRHLRIYVTDVTKQRRAACLECVLPILWRKGRTDLPMDAKRLMARAVWATRRSEEWEPDQKSRRTRVKVE